MITYSNSSNYPHNLSIIILNSLLAGNKLGLEIRFYTSTESIDNQSNQILIN
jgi:hypothetical protein